MKNHINIRALFSLLQSWSFWKSVLSGGITAGVDLSLLFILREIFVWPPLLAVNTSFAVAVVVNFSLQKFWTFSSRNLDLAHKQFVKFLVVAGVNIAMNSIIMFLFISVFDFWYLGAQVVTMGMLATMNFILYRIFVFK